MHAMRARERLIRAIELFDHQTPLVRAQDVETANVGIRPGDGTFDESRQLRREATDVHSIEAGRIEMDIELQCLWPSQDGELELERFNAGVPLPKAEANAAR